MAGPSWRVVGGSEKGGIIVRLGRELNSSEAPSRLATGSLVEELAVQGERLRYKLLHGSGPAEGWVSPSLKDKELLVKEAMSKTPLKSAGAMLSKKWDLEFKFRGCGAYVHTLSGSTAGASRDALFDHLLLQHLQDDLRAEFRQGIPLHLFDTAIADEKECIVYFQTAGSIEPPAKGGGTKSSPEGVRQRVQELGGLRCVVLESDQFGSPFSQVLVLAHGYSVLSDDLYGLAHLLMQPGRRIVLPAARHELEQPVPAEGDENEIGDGEDVQPWRRPLLSWLPPEARDAHAAAKGAAHELARCAEEALQSAPGAKLVFGGFSQGAALAAVASVVGTKPSALVLLAPPDLATAVVAEGSLQAVRVFTAVGSADAVAPISVAQSLLQACTDAGARCEPLLKHPGAHEVTMAVADGVKAFLRKV